MDDLICVGAIAGAFGVHGEVRLKSFTTDPEAITEYAPLSSEDGARTFDLQITRPVTNGFAARLTGVRSKEEADALRGCASLFRVIVCPPCPMMNSTTPI